MNNLNFNSILSSYVLHTELSKTTRNFVFRFKPQQPYIQFRLIYYNIVSRHIRTLSVNLYRSIINLSFNEISMRGQWAIYGTVYQGNVIILHNDLSAYCEYDACKQNLFVCTSLIVEPVPNVTGEPSILHSVGITFKVRMYKKLKFCLGILRLCQILID